MVEYNSTVNINPLRPWLCANSLPTQRSNHLLLTFDCDFGSSVTVSRMKQTQILPLRLALLMHCVDFAESHLGIEHCPGRRQGKHIA